ncbi:MULTISPECIES: ABC1 kinase family protein [unclassified Aureimonas]|uniref:ABC1 kinase family protein n=1 Tax=unclassified Aureimonas TaxID=2615206 RepID=UPI0006FD73F9|nr:MULTISPECIES: AarF/ABC1/UbiB kinase family protein [unclassified Aureimonas]KQT64023.1 ubiquinol-cytochrome C reductase [Aureimonas sp. Leaf427]KQT81216.1 ubiquinol-cytochrome C reductase [Aureimonas sp. Leaf460]
MAPRFPSAGGSAVPSRRLSRLARLGGMATGLAGGMLLDGARQLARGERPRLEDLLLTPGNVLRVTEQLSHLRGAAMKMGQLLSMEAGDILPPELSAIMARLRADAEPMPVRQLQSVLDREWGPGWLDRFERFPFRPIAAASIGQVHRVRTKDGRDLAIKIQYPGVRRSIDSDVDNVATLLRMSGIVPRHLDIAPLLGEAKRQLREEADYEREADCLDRFGDLLRDDDNFRLPAVHRDLTGTNVLAMSYLESVPIETLDAAPQEERDRIAGLLIDLALRELFDFRLMQTDPNLANYRYDPSTRQIVLLDFGATRAFEPGFSEGCRVLAAAGLSDDRGAAEAALTALGLIDGAVPQRHREKVMAMFDTAKGPLLASDTFDFGDTNYLRRLREEGLEFAGERDGWRLPPTDTLFLQRKFGGTYLMAARLKARVGVRALLARHVGGREA